MMEETTVVVAKEIAQEPSVPEAEELCCQKSHRLNRSWEISCRIQAVSEVKQCHFHALRVEIELASQTEHQLVGKTELALWHQTEGPPVPLLLEMAPGIWGRGCWTAPMPVASESM